MKKIFATVALGLLLVSSAFAIPNFMKYFYPEYIGSANDSNVRVVEDQPDVTFIEVNGHMFVIKK